MPKLFAMATYVGRALEELAMLGTMLKEAGSAASAGISAIAFPSFLKETKGSAESFGGDAGREDLSPFMSSGRTVSTEVFLLLTEILEDERSLLPVDLDLARPGMRRCVSSWSWLGT